MAKKSLTYKQAGVDIDTANLFVHRIKPLVRKTHRAEVLSHIGHFAGLFALDVSKYKHPVLVSSADGVGTKLRLALDYGWIDGLGQDLVAMSANDLLCLGAEPLYFLDYFATGKLQLDTATKIVSSIAKCCASIHCSLLGGETAEMPQMYQGNDFDLAGFIVGAVEKDNIIDGSKIGPGDKIIGIASSGIHSNGFSLVRQIIAESGKTLKKVYPPFNRPLGRILLEPTRLYVVPVLELRNNNFPIHGIAHITGGGLLENLPRIIPPHCRAVIDRTTWEMPAVFKLLQEWGNIEEKEMERVFNCGVGMMMVVPKEISDEVIIFLKKRKEKAWILGEVKAAQKGKPNLEIIRSMS